MVICLELGTDLHTAQLMPLPLTVSCFSKIQIGFAFLVPAVCVCVCVRACMRACVFVHPGSPGKRAVKCVCVGVCVVAVTCEQRVASAWKNPRRNSQYSRVVMRHCPCVPMQHGRPTSGHVMWRRSGLRDVTFFVSVHICRHTPIYWLGCRVVSVLDSGAEGPGFKTQPRRDCRRGCGGSVETQMR